MQGQPARAVKVSIGYVIVASSHGETARAEIRGSNPPKGLTAWPEPATTDADGRFTLHGLGRELLVALIVDDPRFASHFVLIAPATPSTPRTAAARAVKLDAGSGPKKLTLALQPAQIITGRVTYADSGKPVPHAHSWSPPSNQSRDPLHQFRGRRRRTVPRQSIAWRPLFVLAQSPDGQPYLGAMKRIDWPKGAVEQSVDLSLPRGVVIGGKVTEEGSGKPVAGAVVLFTPYESANSYPSSWTCRPRLDPTDRSRSRPSRAPAIVVVQGPSDDYVLREMGVNGGRYYAQPGSRRFYAHAYTFLDLKPDSAGQEVNAVIRRGMTVKFRVVDPNDRPVEDATVISRLNLEPAPTGGWKLWTGIARTLGRVRDGRFELHGLDPDTESAGPLL